MGEWRINVGGFSIIDCPDEQQARELLALLEPFTPLVVLEHRVGAPEWETVE